MKTSSSATLVCTAVAAISAGCASTPEPADTQIVKAETSIDLAADGGANEYASDSIDNARNKLTAAKLAAENGEDEEALRLATEAELDAEVAVALTGQAESEAALREVQEGIDTLRRELKQDTYRPGGTQ
jgi:Domain of unknown function (DUF4398)